MSEYTRIPGVALLVTLAVAAWAVTTVLPIGSALIVVIAFGTFIANTVGVPEWAANGVATHDGWLEVGIVTMGATVAIEPIIETGPRLFGLVGVAVVTTLLIVEGLSRTVVGIPEKTGSLLAAGSCICGVSAIAAVAGTIKPDRETIAYAAATVLLFDAVTLVVYPLVGRLLTLPDSTFGIWAGTTMFSTGPATAAGFAYSQTAGEWAVLVKLARNSLIGVVAIVYAIYYNRRATGPAQARAGGPPLRYLWAEFPKFVLGFVAFALLAATGVFSATQIELLGRATDWLFLVAFAGLGLNIDVAAFRRTGFEPVVVVSVSLLVVSTGTLGALLVFF